MGGKPSKGTPHDRRLGPRPAARSGPQAKPGGPQARDSGPSGPAAEQGRDHRGRFA